MKLVIAYCMLVVLAMTLPQTQGAVCSFVQSRRYVEGCGIWRLDACNKHRNSISYRCCPGWSGEVSAGCPIKLPDPEPESADP